MNKQEYISNLKAELIDLDKLPSFEEYSYANIPLNKWSYFPKVSPSVFWKQQSEGYVWVIGLDVDKNGVIRRLNFFRDEWFSPSSIPDEVATDSLNALDFYIPEKTKLWKWGLGIVGFLIALKILKGD